MAAAVVNGNTVSAAFSPGAAGTQTVQEVKCRTKEENPHHLFCGDETNLWTVLDAFP